MAFKSFYSKSTFFAKALWFGIALILTTTYLIFLKNEDTFYYIIVNNFSSSYSKPELLHKLKNLSLYTKSLTLFIISCLIYLVLSVFYQKTNQLITKQIYYYVIYIKHRIRPFALQQFKSKLLEDKLIFTGLIFLIFFHYYFYLISPLHIDEIHSYYYFIKNGFITTLTYFPNPNNHILYNLSSCFVGLFTDSIKLISKLPSIISALLLFIFTYQFFKKRQNDFIALSTALFLQLSDGFFYYAHLGRGYILMSLFVFLAFKHLYQNNKPNRLVVFSVLALWANLSAIYPIVSFIFVLIFQKQISKAIKLSSKIFIGSIVLYLPILILNGTEIFTNNPWVIYNTNTIATYINSTIITINEFILGISFTIEVYYFILLALILIALFTQSKKITISLYILVFSYCLIFIQNIIPYERTFVWQIIFYSLIINEITHKITLRSVKIFFTVVVLTFLIIQLNRYKERYLFNQGIYQNIHRVIQLIPNNQIIYTNDYTYYHYFLIEKTVHTEAFFTKRIDTVKHTTSNIYLINKKTVLTNIPIKDTLYSDEYIYLIK